MNKQVHLAKDRLNVVNGLLAYWKKFLEADVTARTQMMAERNYLKTKARADAIALECMQLTRNLNNN